MECEGEIQKMIDLPFRRSRSATKFPAKELMLYQVIATYLPKGSDEIILRLMALIFAHFGIEKGAKDKVYQRIRQRFLRFQRSLTSLHPAKD